MVLSLAALVIEPAATVERLPMGETGVVVRLALVAGVDAVAVIPDQMSTPDGRLRLGSATRAGKPQLLDSDPLAPVAAPCLTPG